MHISCIMGMGTGPCDASVCYCAACLSDPAGPSRAESSTRLLHSCVVCSEALLCPSARQEHFLGEQIWVLHFPCDVLWLTPTYSIEKSCEPADTGMVSSSLWFFKLILTKCKICMCRNIHLYVCTHVYSAYTVLGKKPHRTNKQQYKCLLLKIKVIKS